MSCAQLPLASQVLAVGNNPTHVKARRSANFSPCIWGDHFLSYASMETTKKETEQHIQELKEEVTRMLMTSTLLPSQRLDLIDQIQRLGVSYHLETEIHQLLGQIHSQQDSSSYDHHDDEDLYTASLRFRLLRQQGFKVSCKVLNKFVDARGNFKKSLVADVRGLLSLYEATHLRTHGEDILDQALVFTTTQLELAVAANSLPPQLVKKVKLALDQPLWTSYQRFVHREYISTYHEGELNNALLSFAKLDFNRLQKVHQKELSEITRWWKELEFANKLTFARNRVVECYAWTLGVYFEPHYEFGRNFNCKILCLLSVMDDTYDTHGTLEEIELFTQAVERWDISALDSLPEYMKLIYQALLDIYADAEIELAKMGKMQGINYAREAMKIHVKAYLSEAKWFHQKYTPETLNEYMSVAIVTSCLFVLTVSTFVGMVGDTTIVEKDSLDWFFTFPKSIVASGTVGRLMNDITTYKLEKKRGGHIPSSVECYMKEHCGTEEEAVTELTKQSKNAWKDINEEWIQCAASIHKPLLLLVINQTRTVEGFYKHGDGYTLAKVYLKDDIPALLIDPVPI